MICDMIRRPGGLVSGNMPDRGSQISVLVIKNLKLAAFMSKRWNFASTTSSALTAHQYQWELEQKKKDDTKVPKVHKDNWAKTIENIVLYLKLVRGVRGVLLAYVIWCHIKVPHFPNKSDKYHNFDMEMTARAFIVNKMSISRHSEVSLEEFQLVHSRLTMPLCSKYFPNSLVTFI